MPLGDMPFGIIGLVGGIIVTVVLLRILGFI